MIKTGYTPTEPAVEQQLAEWRASSEGQEAPLRFRALGFAVKGTIIGFLIIWFAAMLILLPLALLLMPVFGPGFLFSMGGVALAIRWMMKK